MIQDLTLSFEEIMFKMVIPLALSALFAYLIGYERQKVGKSAGISSHILVAFASASIAILQRLLFEAEIELIQQGVLVSAQSQRIVAQVLTGIGFIGAGVILKEKGSIKGITTAATIWSSSILGIIIGSGYLVLGTLVGIFVVVFVFLRDFVRGFNPFKDDEHSTEDHL